MITDADIIEAIAQPQPLAKEAPRLAKAPTHTLTTAQQHVVDRMRVGWSLGLTMTLTGGYWLQQGGLGRGGATESVHANTAHALRTKGVIQSVRRVFPVEEFQLTEAWRKPQKETSDDV